MFHGMGFLIINQYMKILTPLTHLDFKILSIMMPLFGRCFHVDQGKLIFKKY